jgi:hypothetical protein
MKSALRIFSVGLLFIVIGLSWGCATSSEENVAERPWNAPKNWEHGLPPSMLEGR